VVDVFRGPWRPAKHAADVPNPTGSADRVRGAGIQTVIPADDSQPRLECPVVQVAGVAEMGIVRVPRGAEPLVEQVFVRVQDGTLVEFQRQARVVLFRGLGSQVA